MRAENTSSLSISDLISLTPPPENVRATPRAELFGPFRVYEQLGQGGMATVHRAELGGPRGGRKMIALKRLWSDLSEDPEFVQSFVHEAELAKRLEHPNIARTYEHGTIDDTFYIAMELVRGPTLAQIMTQSGSAAGAIPLHLVVGILIQLCDALDHAHNQCDEVGRPLGIIHRDVAPANVIVSNGGIVKLIDFGVAKASTGRQTQVGIIKGKLAYVAPEYTYGVLDQRADLFSLGVVAYELITGQRLLLGGTPLETITNVREKPIQPPSRYNVHVSRDLDDILITAVQRDPTLRWQSAAAMRVALTNVARTLPPAGSAQIRTWVEWAFTQQPRPENSILRVLGELETSASNDLGSEPLLADLFADRPIPTPARVAIEPPREVKRPHRSTAKMKARRGTSPWLVLLLLAALAGAGLWTGYAQLAYEAVARLISG